MTHRYGWGGEVQGGSPGMPTDFTATYANNRRDGFTYDAAGDLTYDGGQTFTYDATGQQATASYGGYSLQNSYDGDRLRVKKAENGLVTYYLRSSVLGGQVVAEANSSGGWYRGYVYGAGGEMLGIQANGAVAWAYQDPATKSQRLADSSGAVTAAVDLDPWGLETGRSWNSQQQTRRYTTYERDGNQSDDAMMRRHNRWHMRFDQPDPYEGSYDLSDPQSLNRYAYVGGDPVNFTDPTGLMCYNVIRTDVYTDTGEVIGSAVVGSFCTGGWRGYQGRGLGLVRGVGHTPPPDGQNTDPCAHLLPANIPPNVSVDENIALGEKLYKEWGHTTPVEPGSRAADAAGAETNRAIWFEKQTGDHGPMDYKYLTTDMRYDDFGNFNYGAVGAAVGYTSGTLLRVAGWVQQQGANAHLGKGQAPWSRVQAYIGVGGEPPFGDKPGDQVQIQNGIDYYNCRKAHPLR